MEFNSKSLDWNSVGSGNFFRQTAPAMDGWHRRLTSRLDFLGWSVKVLADRSGVSLDNCHKYVQGRVKQPRGDTITKLAEAIGVSALWLRDGIGPEFTKIPVVGHVSAGETAIVPFDDYAPGSGFGEVEFNLEGTDAIAIEIRGTSMLPVYRPGDRLICSRYRGLDIDRCVNQDCVVKTADDESYIKIVRKGSSKGLYTLESYNRAFEPKSDVELKWAAPIVWVNRAQWQG